MKENGRFRALETTLNSIQKRYGEGAIMRLGQASHLQVEAIPTGSLALDLALGVGGVPRGRVTEVYGPEGSGKTTLAQHIVAEAQKRGKRCILLWMNGGASQIDTFDMKPGHENGGEFKEIATAAEGVRFEAAIAPSPVTLPSHASMLTGLDPWALGILDNGIYRLAPELDSLAEILAAEGFETAAFNQTLPPLRGDTCHGARASIPTGRNGSNEAVLVKGHDRRQVTAVGTGAVAVDA